MSRRPCLLALLVVLGSFTAPARAAVLPDLVVTGISAPSSVVAGSPVTVKTTVKNLQGRAGSSYVRVVLSKDKLVGSTDKVLGKRFVSALAAGATSTGSKTWTIPAGTAAGAWFLVACADATKLVKEAREGNNCRARAITVTPANRPPVAVADGFETPEDQALVVTAAELLENDTDADGDALAATAVGSATNGSVDLLDGLVTFTPDPDFHGTAGFSYTLSDGVVSVQGSVTVEVLAVSPAFQVDQESSVVEGAYATAQVRLTDKPDADVTVTVTAVGDNVWPTVDSLTFTPVNWSTPQQLTVAALQDDDTVDGVGVVELAATGLTTAQVGWNIIDDDTQAIVPSPTTVSLGEAGTTTFGVRLAYKPASDVTVSVGSGDTGAATVSPATMTFTPGSYATPQTVTVTGVADTDLANESVTVTLSSPGISSASVTATVTDDDTQAIDVSVTTLMVAEGSSNTVGIRLAYQPASGVTVAVASGNTAAATVAPATLTFSTSNWNTFQNVTVSGVQDMNLAAESATLQVTSTGLTSRTVSVVVADDDTQVVHASATSKSIREGTSSTVEITLSFQPPGNTTVTCAANPAASVGVSPATMTFTPANYATPQILNLTGTVDGDQVDDEATVTCSATNATSAVIAVTVVEIV